MSINAKQIIVKVTKLLKDRGIPKIKLGEALGSKGGDTAKITLANKFLKGKTKIITVDVVNALAQFFDKPITYFLEEENVLRSTEHSYKVSAPLSAQEVARSLRRENYDEEFIGNIVKQIEYENKKRPSPNA